MRPKIVLIVDEDPAALELCWPVLEQNGYQILKATNTEQALGFWSWYSEEIDFALVDRVMAGMTGLEQTAEDSAASHGKDQVNKLIAEMGSNYLIFRRPYDLTIFLQITSNLLGKAKSAAPISQPSAN